MSRGKGAVFFPLSALVLLFLMFLGLCLGVSPSPPGAVTAALLGGGDGDPLRPILLHVRLPRVLGAVMSGSGLAVSGAMIQGVLANPLASPNTMGVNAGAGLFVLLASVFLPRAAALAPLAAFLGALLAAALVLLISGFSGQPRLGLVLTGLAVGSLFSAGMNAVLILFPDAYVGAGSFLAGGLGGVTMGSLLWPCCYLLPGLLVAFACAPGLNLLSLGKDTASSLGMRAAVWRLIYLMVAAALAGAAVSFAGLLGFVGLLVPHGVRLVTGYDNRLVLPACALWGAAFVLLCDLCARSLFAPYELPVGILMSILGCPAFLLLVCRSGRGRDD